MNGGAEAQALEQVLRLLDETVAALEHERKAIVSLDADAIGRTAEAKRALAEQLRALTLALVTPPRGHPLSERVRQRGQTVQHLAMANALLLDDAKSAMAEALGISTVPLTYDRRARPGVSVAPQRIVNVRGV